MTAADESHANASARQFLRNALSSYANLIVGVILSLVLTRVLLVHLGASTYGLWIVLLTIVSYLSLLDVGVSTAIVQRTARMTAEGDQAGLANVIRTGSVFFSVSGLLAVVITAVLAPFLSSIVHLGDNSAKASGITLVLLGAMIATKFMAAVPNAILFGVGRNDRMSQIGVAGLFVTQIAQVIAVLLGGGLVWLGIVTLAGTAFSYWMTSYLVRRMTGFSVVAGHFERRILVDLLTFGGRNTVIAISGIISYSLDALIIGVILPVAQVAPYDIALSTANLTRNLTTYGSDLLLPTYTHLEIMKDPHRQARVFARTVMATLAISLPILVALAAFGDPILKLWLGTVPPKTYSIMIALGFVTALELPGHQCFIFLTGIGRNQMMMRMAVLGASINFVGSIIFTFLLGPIGPAIGSLPAVLVIDFTVLPIIVCRYLDVPVRRYVKDALVPVLPAVAVAGALAVLILWLFPVPHHARVVTAGLWAVASAAVVVLGAWVTIAGVTLRIEPDMRAKVVARIRRRTNRGGGAATIGVDGQSGTPERGRHQPVNDIDVPEPSPTIRQHASTAVPTWFGPEDRPLFGWVHVPDAPTGRGVVLCPSVGIEGEATQMAYRRLAVALADSGCAVLRFDYDGTGDSAGSPTDPGRLASWIAGIHQGLDYLGEAGALQLHLVGSRLGATLAVRAADGRQDVASLTLWYPWTKGSQFVRYQRALRRLYATGPSSAPGDDSTEIPGFVLAPELARDLMALDSSDPTITYPKATLVIDAADVGTGRVGSSAFGPEGCPRRTGTGAEALFGVELMRATIDEADVKAIVAYLEGFDPPGTPSAIRPVVRTEARFDVPGGVTVVERPVTFGPAHLFGILAEPLEGTTVPDPAGSTRLATSGGPVPAFASAVFLNAGSLHHVGPGRQWVELSRRWAARGMHCLRMDLGGVGDSPLHGPPGTLSSYPPSALDDVAEAVAFLAPDRPRDVVLLGLCSGAFHSLLAAPPTGVGGVAVLNPLRLPTPGAQVPGSIGDLIASAPAAWSDVEPGRSAEPAPTHRRFLGSLRDRGVFRPLTRHLPDRFWWALHRVRGGSDPVASIRPVVESGAALCIVLGPDEWPGIGRGRVHELRRLSRSGVFQIVYVPTLDHNFHVASGRTQALAVLDDWVLGPGGSGNVPGEGVSTIR